MVSKLSDCTVKSQRCKATTTCSQSGSGDVSLYYTKDGIFALCKATNKNKNTIDNWRLYCVQTFSCCKSYKLTDLGWTAHLLLMISWLLHFIAFSLWSSDTIKSNQIYCFPPKFNYTLFFHPFKYELLVWDQIKIWCQNIIGGINISLKPCVSVKQFQDQGPTKLLYPKTTLLLQLCSYFL